MSKIIKTFEVVSRKITISKPYTIQTMSGKKTFKPGYVLWHETAKKAESGWPIHERGFVIDHYHGYGQNELFPWENIKLTQKIETRKIVVSKSKKEILKKEDFFSEKA